MSELPKAVSGSVIQSLRANRERLVKDQTKVIRLPGWDSLYARYKRLPWEKVRNLDALGENADATEQISEAIEVIIAACDGILFRDGDNEIDLGVKYDQELAKLIGDDEAAMPAEVVMSVLSDELTLMTHVGTYMEWAARQEDESDERLGKASQQTNEST